MGDLLLLENGGGFDGGFFELPYVPYIEPVYYEPIPEPVYFELPPPPEPVYVPPPPAPVPAPEPIAQPMPIYQELEPIKEEFFGLPYEGFEPAPIPVAITQESFVAESEPYIAPEPVYVVGAKPMAEDFYYDDYGGDFYDGGYSYVPEVSFLANGGGGGFDYYGAGGDFFYGYGFDDPVADSFFELPMPDYEPLPYIEPIDYAPLPDTFFELPNLPIYEQEPFFPQLPFTQLPDYVLEPLPPIELFPEVIQMETEQGYVSLPTLAPLPFVPSPIDLPFGDFFGLPYLPDPLPPPVAPPTTTPTAELPCVGRTANGLPPPCPAGYGRGPFGSDPCLCYPLPPATTQTQTPKPPTTTQTPKPPTPQQTAQQQQTCPTGYCKHPQTGQCLPIPQGWQRHPQTQVCVPITQQVSPLPIPTEVGGALDELKKLPWWVWAGLAGVVLLTGRR